MGSRDLVAGNCPHGLYIILVPCSSQSWLRGPSKLGQMFRSNHRAGGMHKCEEVNLFLSHGLLRHTRTAGPQLQNHVALAQATYGDNLVGELATLSGDQASVCATSAYGRARTSALSPPVYVGMTRTAVSPVLWLRGNGYVGGTAYYR